MPESSVFAPKAFLQWFEESGGWVDKALLGLQPFPGMGFGAVALSDIPADRPLFHIPDKLILSAETSLLQKHLSPSDWESLNHGWCQLITVMMWETVRGRDSPWYGYLTNLPTSFDTPMFWTEAEKSGLDGTDLQDRIGKEEAESQYHDYVKPIIDSQTALFPPGSEHTTLTAFHLQGSRILSRSFTIPKSHFSADDAARSESDTSESDDSDDDEATIAVMIPLADMLNAAYERDNANLHVGDNAQSEQFTESGGFVMKSTQSIQKSSQIYNTYASPPNAELLRKYGHVDILPLSPSQIGLLEPAEIGDWPFGNPGDEVLIDGARVLDVVGSKLAAATAEDWKSKMQARIDWWLDEGQDDTFALNLDSDVDDDALVAFTRLLLYDEEWLRAKKKGKLPRTTIDNTVATILETLFKQRKALHRQDISHDLESIKEVAMRSSHIPRSSKQNAVCSSADELALTPSELRAVYTAIVRLGEQRILNVALRRIAPNVQPAGKRKRTGEESS